MALETPDIWQSLAIVAFPDGNPAFIMNRGFKRVYRPTQPGWPAGTVLLEPDSFGLGDIGLMQGSSGQVDLNNPASFFKTYAFSAGAIDGSPIPENFRFIVQVGIIDTAGPAPIYVPTDIPFVAFQVRPPSIGLGFPE